MVGDENYTALSQIVAPVKMSKCAHKGCGKVFTDPNEPCVYHPGPPEFHEGQKGWKCCKPRVLTFDEFLSIPPCTTGKHSTVDEHAEEQAKASAVTKANIEDNAPKRVPISQPQPVAGGDSKGPSPSAIASASTPIPPKQASPAPEIEEDSDDASIPAPDNASCKRRSCGKSVKDIRSVQKDPYEDECIYHPGTPIFHEGSKGWSCCKRRVLEFDEFMKIEGCKTRKGHCFIGKRAAAAKKAAGNVEEKMDISSVRNDFYQTASALIVSFYLKKIDKARASVRFKEDGSGVDLDLPTSDGKRAVGTLETWQDINPAASQSKVMGTKLELVLVKQDAGVGWPVLRRGDRDTGERIQVGQAGRA